MATSIIAALQERDSQLNADGTGTVAPIEINIDTGVKIDGSRNVICAGGAAGGVPLVKKKDAQTYNNHHDQKNETGDGSGSKRKRAQSVGSCLPTSYLNFCCLMAI